MMTSDLLSPSLDPFYKYKAKLPISLQAKILVGHMKVIYNVFKMHGSVRH